ncbi:helix-turn-helix transcriptional regulator [Jannaschia seohaensis]|uniref:DNA-binding CsgD family transcriptional regulator n=1 Tax=Jannaschia seohaensis TaxID=475081 RepID=A0A2Y9AXW1_9RHOB|nr:autoinducer binding domain-containing protein [Jannaschia seohaensis]PWJ16498.1 DNA-binding CsgD family transcriptional regulator [Jannaschia seohaensis]SSA48735.1 DNA-binding transcriptional regulator, CsgD family [Jannaschia seohaensis]
MTRDCRTRQGDERHAADVSGPSAPPNEAEALAAVSRLLEASDIESVWAALRAVLARYGFDRLNYTHAPALRDPVHLSRSLRFTLTSHSDPRMERIYRSEVLDRSPMRRWAAENVGAISWSRQPELLREYGMEADGPELNALLADLGFHAGYTIGFPFSALTGKAAMGLTARPDLDQPAVDAIWGRHGPAIEALAGAAHARMSQLPLELPNGRLSPRQREILSWIADGKSVQDVAILMDRSLAAIEKQLREARKRLGVETTAQAVARVALLNQLSVPGRAG